MVSHLVSVSLVVLITYLCMPFSTLFAWHPSLMMLGYAGFMFQAIIVFNRDSSFLMQKPRPMRVFWHWLLHCCAVVAITGGFIAIVWNKNNHGKPHFQTWHSRVGLLAIVATFLQMIGGVLSKYPSVLKGRVRVADLRLYHATAAIFTFLCSCAAIALGMSSNWFNQQVSWWMWYFTVTAVGLLGLAVTKQVTENYLPKLQASKRSSSSSHAPSNASTASMGDTTVAAKPVKRSTATKS